MEVRSFPDAVRSIRSGGLLINDIGTKVTMRETRDANLLVGITQGLKVSDGRKKIASAINSKLGNQISKVLQLGVNRPSQSHTKTRDKLL